MQRAKTEALPDWYALSNEVLDAFSSAIDVLKLPVSRESDEKRDWQIKRGFYSLFSSFSRDCSYLSPGEQDDFHRDSEFPNVDEVLTRIAQACNHIGIHFWDPVTGERRRILNHHLGEFDTSLVTNDFRSWFEKLDEIYAEATYRPGDEKTTFVQSMARVAIKNGRPVLMIVCSQDQLKHVPTNHAECAVVFPFKEMSGFFRRLGVDNAIEMLRRGEEREGISKIFSEMPAGFEESSACLKCGERLSKISEDKRLLDPSHLWPALAGLNFWHCAGYPIFPYVLSLVPIRFPSKHAEQRRGIFFALSGRIEALANAAKSPSRKPAASRMIEDSIKCLERLAEGIANSLQTLTVSLNEVFYARWHETHVFDHELGNALNALTEWFETAQSSNEYVDLSGYCWRTLLFMKDYRKVLTGVGVISPSGEGLRGNSFKMGQDSSHIGNWKWPELMRDVVYAVTDKVTEAKRLDGTKWDFGDGKCVSFRSCRTNETALSLFNDWPRPDVSYMLLRAVISNLVRNAYRHSTEWPIKIEVRLARTDHIAIAVVDTGKPFNPPAQELVKRSLSGTGLRVVKDLVRTLALLSPNKTVQFEIPRLNQTTRKRFQLILPVAPNE